MEKMETTVQGLGINYEGYGDLILLCPKLYSIYLKGDYTSMIDFLVPSDLLVRISALRPKPCFRLWSLGFRVWGLGFRA